MNWHRPCAYDPDVKETFHRTARARLRKLATLMGWQESSFDLRNNRAGVAVSGEVTLHHDRVYIQVSQPATGHDSGILIRRCKGARTTPANAITSRACRFSTICRRSPAASTPFSARRCGHDETHTSPHPLRTQTANHASRVGAALQERPHSGEGEGHVEGARSLPRREAVLSRFSRNLVAVRGRTG